MQIAVLKETGGRGPYSSLVMAVVIVKDVVVFVCFAVNIEMSDVVRCRSHPALLPLGVIPLSVHCHISHMSMLTVRHWGQVMRKSGEGFGISILFEPVVSLAVSTVLGLMFGILIGRLLGVPARPFNVFLRRLPPAAQTRCPSADISLLDPLKHQWILLGLPYSGRCEHILSGHSNLM